MTRNLYLHLILLGFLLLGACDGQHSGDLTECEANVTCAPATPDPCRTYATVCSAGVASCAVAGNRPDGTSCGSVQSCQAGVCTAIAASGSADVSGGHLTTSDGVVVEIPPGAVDAETEISVALTSRAAPAEAHALSGVYDLQPGGHVFARPVTVKFPLPTGTTAASVYWQRLDGSGFHAIGGVIDPVAHTITALTPSFGLAFVGASSPTRTITGVAQTTWISATTRSSVALPVEAEVLLPDGHGGYTSVPAVAGADGAFTIAGMPTGEYVLHAGTQYLVTDSNAPDLGQLAAGRPPSELTAIDGGSLIELSLTGLSPWPDDLGEAFGLELFTTESGTWDFISELWSVEPIVAGDTSATLALDLAATNGTARAPALIQESNGDRLVVAQITPSTTAGGVTYVGITRIAELPPFDTTSGGESSVTAVMQDLPQSESLSVDWRGSAWAAALAQDANPVDACDTLPCGGGVSMLALPGTTDDGIYSANADLLHFEDVAPAGSDVQTGHMRFGSTNAFPGTWNTAFDAGWFSFVLRRLPGTVRGGATADTIRWTTVPSALKGPLTPPLTPPTSIKVGTADFFAGGSAMGTAPTLSWAAPRVGTPGFYRVLVRSLSVAGSNRTVFQTVADIVTPHLTFAFPPGTLTSGQSYIFEVAAYQVSGPLAALAPTSPSKSFSDTAYAKVVSGIFTP